MAIAKRLRRQAATCAALARQTHDEQSRERFLRLEQMYLELAEADELDDSSGRAAGEAIATSPTG